MGLAVSLLSVSNVFALGLGEVTWKSNLNQPLNAEITLYDVKNITNRELIVKLASPEDFAKIGLDRPHALTDLVFTPSVSNGKGVIKITSNKPIKEPYLDFLISVSWASGETLREYTLLIDPPAYEPPQVVSQPSKLKPLPAVKPQPVASNKPVIASNDKAPVQKKTEPKVASNSAKPAAAVPGTVKANKGSSLWAVAQRTKGNTSVHQAMIAIYEANPEAFIDGKMSLLKQGAVLRIPDRDEMRQQTRAEALSQVLANVNGTASTVAKNRQVTAGKTSQVASSTASASQDQLKLTGVAESDTNASGAVGGSDKATIVNLTTKVAQAEEDLDATERKNNELRDRMNDLESRLASMKKLIELKDNQLAALQINIANANKQATPAPDEDKATNEQAVQAEPVKGEQTAPATGQQPQPTPDGKLVQ